MPHPSIINDFRHECLEGEILKESLFKCFLYTSEQINLPLYIIEQAEVIEMNSLQSISIHGV